MMAHFNNSNIKDIVKMKPSSATEDEQQKLSAARTKAARKMPDENSSKYLSSG
jgi:hypothetical protein